MSRNKVLLTTSASLLFIFRHLSNPGRASLRGPNKQLRPDISWRTQYQHPILRVKIDFRVPEKHSLRLMVPVFFIKSNQPKNGSLITYLPKQSSYNSGRAPHISSLAFLPHFETDRRTLTQCRTCSFSFTHPKMGCESNSFMWTGRKLSSHLTSRIDNVFS